MSGIYLKKASLIDDQHAASWITDLLHHKACQLVLDGVGVLDGAIQQALSAIRIGQLPAILARHWGQQRLEIAGAASARFGPVEVPGEARVKVSARGGQLVEVRGSHWKLQAASGSGTQSPVTAPRCQLRL